MLPGPRLLLLFPLAALLACGSSSSPSTPASAYLNLTGDWVALAPAIPSTPGALPSPITDFMGALQSSGGTVIGTLHAISPVFPQCVSFTQDLQASGTIDPNGELTLTVPIAGGTATITATIVTPESYSNGTWQITGGDCAMPATAISIAQFAPATGTYTGILNVLNTTTGLPVAGTATNVTAALIQSTTPNAHGQFPLSGTITATGACTGTFPIANEVVAGGVFIQLVTPNPAVEFSGGILPTATMLIADLSSYSACSSQLYHGILTRQ
jgi:hypothetical protein